MVRVRRSPRCNISWAISCTSVENSSAGCIPESSVIFPPYERPFAGAIRSEKLSSTLCDSTNLNKSFAVSAHVAIDFGQCWEFFAFGLS